MNKYEKIFNKNDGEINYEYELKKANIIINNLIDQRNTVLNEMAMLRAEYTLLNEELISVKKENKTETEQEDTNAEENTIYYIKYYSND